MALQRKFHDGSSVTLQPHILLKVHQVLWTTARKRGTGTPGFLNRFQAPDVALLLLSFKNRKLRATTTIHTPRFHNVIQGNRRSKDYGPDEVQRYMEFADMLMPKDRDDCDALGWLISFDNRLLEEFFECT
ncbi:hypothetical protein GE09DRAFT_750570 [Coniochaeta sp. 2T2.1]|nr:hypothetical protein GE09DRAFT_750570 [Coniochaeta sp. 2T2.1]